MAFLAFFSFLAFFAALASSSPLSSAFRFFSFFSCSCSGREISYRRSAHHTMMPDTQHSDVAAEEDLLTFFSFFAFFAGFSPPSVESDAGL